MVIERATPVTIKVGAIGVKRVFTLMQAYAPNTGDDICSVEFFGDAGADETFRLIAGVNVRDFFESCFSRTINNTTTRPAFEFIGQGGAYTDNTTTGPRGFYDFDEQEFDLDAAFANQTLDRIKVTAYTEQGTPILLGVTAVTSAEPEASIFTSFRFWLILGAVLTLLAVVGLVLGIRHWLNTP